MQEQLDMSSNFVRCDWEDSSEQECRLHQLAPYIGKLKPVIARRLIQRFTKIGDIVLDCFSGSGTIPLEAMLLNRRVLAFDANPYALTLTRAKLEPPISLGVAEKRLAARIYSAQLRPRYEEDEIPHWVRKFFHPETLQNALRFADECIEKDDQFLLACLLGILHHQRPGFLSYPSSHLVPYLRDRKFPRDIYPEMYEERDLRSRLQAKLVRIYKGTSGFLLHMDSQTTRTSIADVRINHEVDAIVTSPPYMNALDYIRDNRLRMWFLDRKTANYSPEPTDDKNESDAITEAFAKNALSRLRIGGRCVLVIGETVRRKRVTTHPAQRMYSKLVEHHPRLFVEEIIEDEIPDIRRSRRSASATKRELILILRKD